MEEIQNQENQEIQNQEIQNNLNTSTVPSVADVINETPVDVINETPVAEVVIMESANDKIITSNYMDPEDYEYQDDTQITEPDENFKYTKIDCLDEDEEIPGQRFYLVSFASPENIMNCKLRGLKVRGFYSTESEARRACAKLQKTDKYFDIYVAEVGKWCPQNPTSKQVQETVYKNKTEGKIMQNLQKKELEVLNEIVGRQKESIDSSKVSHKKRMAKSMKDNVQALNSSTQEQDELDEKNREDKISAHRDKPVIS